MRIFKQLDQLPSFKNSVLTIGTYDGVHIGHQRILQRINTLANGVNGESILITFHPHPRSVVGKQPVQLISLLAEKLDLLKKYEIDNVVVVPFTLDFANQAPADYIQHFLVKHFTPKKIVIGYNHQFGKNRGGDIHLLRSMQTALGFEVEEISKQQIDDLSISSTKIRKALLVGDIKTATSFLGHPYFLRGMVIKGQQVGKTIGFPTANIQVNASEKLIPAKGVYAVRVPYKNQYYKGMLNIGTRPTVDGQHQTIEVHLFDFDKDIYGENLQIDFVAAIRQEQKFPNLTALQKQLQEDSKTAKALL